MKVVSNRQERRINKLFQIICETANTSTRQFNFNDLLCLANEIKKYNNELIKDLKT